MRVRFRSLTGVLFFFAVATGFPFAAVAEPTSSSLPFGNETMSETFNRAFFTNDPEFFRNRSFGRQLGFILGIPSSRGNSFPENEITRDAEVADVLYQDGLEQQVSSGPIIRTRDLPNPYQTSILRSPRFNVNNRAKRNEFIFDALPRR